MKEKLNWWIAKHKFLSKCVLCAFFCVIYGVLGKMLNFPIWAIILLQFVIGFVVIIYIDNSPMYIVTKSIDELNENCDPYPLKRDLEELLSYKNSIAVQQGLLIDYALVHRSLGEYEKNYELLSSINIDKDPGTLPLVKVVYYNNLMDASFHCERYEEAGVWFNKMTQIYADIKNAKQKAEVEMLIDAAVATDAFCKQDYAKTIAVLDDVVSKDIRMKVDLSLLYARACMMTGDKDTAREKLEYVIEKGNKLYCVTVARELLEQLGGFSENGVV